MGLILRRAKSTPIRKVKGEGKRNRKSPHGSMFYFSYSSRPSKVDKHDSSLNSKIPVSPPDRKYRDSSPEADDGELLFDFKSLLEITDEELKLDSLVKTESGEEADEISQSVENKSASEDSKKLANLPIEDDHVDEKPFSKFPSPSISDPILTLTFPSIEFPKERSITERWGESEEIGNIFPSFGDEGVNKASNEDKKEPVMSRKPTETNDSPKRVLVMSDMIALNNLPSKNDPSQMTHKLELDDMWEIVGSALVKHQGIRSLLLELASPMHVKDLPLLERWAHAKLHSPQIRVSFASQAQVFELNALKRQSNRRSKDRRKPRIRQRVLRNVPDWSGGKRHKLVVHPIPYLHTAPTLLQPPKPRQKNRRRSANRESSVKNAERIMPIKCLFIDVEGIITPFGGPRLPRHYREISESIASRLLILKRVVYLTRCKLILTSAGRSDPRYVMFVNSFFKSWGINPFYSATLPFHPENHLVRLLPENKRAQEVEQWIASRNVKSWCVVDTMDLSILEKDGVERTVMVNGNIGLTRRDGQTILNILGEELDLYR